MSDIVKLHAQEWKRCIINAGGDENVAQQAVALAALSGLFDILRIAPAIHTWARARAAMNFVKINTPECAAAYDALGAAETALAALSATNGDGNKT